MAGAETEGRPDADRQIAVHWRDFYGKLDGRLSEPSQFAKWCGPLVRARFKTADIMDVGCGNGRDTAYWYSQGNCVLGVDPCREAAELAEKLLHRAAPGLWWSVACTDACDHSLAYGLANVVYARWFLHSITQETQDDWLSLLRDRLCPGSLLCVEARTTMEGRHVERFDPHYRRLICPMQLLDELLATEFRVEESLVSDRYSTMSDDRPLLLRVIARKK